MLYNFYIYNKKGKCLFYKEWNRPLNTFIDDPEEEKKLMFGMLFSLKDLAKKISPVGFDSNEGLHIIKTNTFTLHHFQSLTGMIFILNTDSTVTDLYLNLQHIYSRIFVECLARNPLYSHNPDKCIDCPLFASKLEEYVQNQSFSK